MKKMKSISLSIPESQCRQLDALAQESCRSRAEYIRRLIYAYLQYIKQHPTQKIE